MQLLNYWVVPIKQARRCGGIKINTWRVLYQLAEGRRYACLFVIICKYNFC